MTLPARQDASFRLPNAMLIGPGRTGTTSLFNLLSQHPQVTTTAAKETQIFRPVLRGQAPAPLSQYGEQFPRETAECRLEGSPSYFQGGAKIAMAVQNALGDIPLVVTLRDPADRFLSVYEHVANKVLFDPDFPLQGYVDRALRVAREGVGIEEDFHFLGIVESDYGRLLGEWREIFPAERLLVLFYEDVLEDSAEVRRALAEHLGIDTAPLMACDLPYTNKAIPPRSAGLHRLASAIGAAVEPQLRNVPAVRSVIRSGYYALNGSGGRRRRAEMVEEVRTMLQRECPSLAALGASLEGCKTAGRNAPRWVADYSGANR